MDASVLDVHVKPSYSNSIVSWEYHTHLPFSTQTYNNNDEIRIAINQQDVFTLPSQSFILIEGKVELATGADPTKVQLKDVNFTGNGACFLFEEVRLEMSGSIEVDRVKNVGVSTTMKDYLVLSDHDMTALSHTGFRKPGATIDGFVDNKSDFVFCIPLNRLLSVFERFDKVLLNVKQELILLRSSNDEDALVTKVANKNQFKVNVQKISWKVPYLRVDEVTKLRLLKTVNADKPLNIPFHKWELYENPTVPQSKRFMWTVKTASQSNKPRYAVIGFQTSRKSNSALQSNVFDSVKVSDIRLWLNSTYYPYDASHGTIQLFYDNYCRFKSSYFAHDEFKQSPLLDFKTFQQYAPLYVINCSHQDESIKTGSVDVRLDVTCDENIGKDTIAYCALIYDEVVQYRPLTGLVRKLL
jgi:hypothetical protein